jgi:TonB family protein
MMIVMAWMLYCVLIAAMLAAGAAAWEGAARWSGRPARWGWLAALMGSVTLPWLLRLVPERGWVETIPAAATMLRMEALTPGSAAPAGAVWSAQEMGLALWLGISVLMLAYVAVLLLRLARARQRWRVTELDGDAVLMTADVGPAVVGLRRAVVVLPSWVTELDAELRSLLLRHERAHVQAGDPRLLLTSLVLLAVMPWNPVVWLLALRLRNAIELDCDARVLSAGADPRRYGSLLLEVGRRRSSHALVMATFAEPRVFLEERIRRIAKWPLQRSPARAALLTTTAVLLVAVALSCADPLRVVDPPNDMRDAAQEARTQAEAATDAEKAVQPVFTPMTVAPELQNRDEVQSALVSHYPPLLRDAGIDGSPTIHFFIDSTGVVVRTMLAKSSGYPALDAAALAVARGMTFSPAKNRERDVSVWVEIPIVFSAKEPQGVPVDTAAQAMGIPPRPGARDVRRPPPIGRALAASPYFTPMTAAPELLNRAEVREALVS